MTFGTRFGRTLLAGLTKGMPLLLVACSSSGGSSGPPPTDNGRTSAAPTAAPTSAAGRDAGGGTADSGSTGSGEGGPSTSAVLGATCQTDAECGAGLTCVPPTRDFGPGYGSPANGYCSIDCLAAGGPQSCAAHAGTCFDFSVNAASTDVWCILGCTVGASSSAKCAGRSDLACMSEDASSTQAHCWPLCTGNAGCGGRTCDATGYCRATPVTGDPVGTPCTSTTAAPNGSCEGLCISHVDPAGNALALTCSRLCVLGNDASCGSPSGDGGAAGSACGAAPAANAVNGDVGYCVQRCSQSSDCLDRVPADTIVCDTSAQTVAGYGSGLCFPAADVPSSASSSGDAGQGGG
jgi:hypothetical protein